ncbi:MAG: hypothetical protein RL291_436, partial [Pseudomonadota bacterium]
EQARIDELERKAKADGHISRKEFTEIQRAQAYAGQHIREEASNQKVSFWRRWLYRNRY